MILAIFESNIKKLAKVYGEKLYPDERVEIFWQMVKDFPEESFSRQVQYWIANNKQAPLGLEFQEFVKKQNYHKQIQIKTNLANDHRCIS